MKRTPVPASRIVLASDGRRASAPASSYWADPSLTREQLKALIAERRAQQRTPTPSEMSHDPMLAATSALIQDHGKRWKTT